jgi:hypothetical protein
VVDFLELLARADEAETKVAFAIIRQMQAAERFACDPAAHNDLVEAKAKTEQARLEFKTAKSVLRAAAEKRQRIGS